METYNISLSRATRDNLKLLGHPPCRTKGSDRRFRFRIITICRLIDKFSVPTSPKLVDIPWCLHSQMYVADTQCLSAQFALGQRAQIGYKKLGEDKFKICMHYRQGGDSSDLLHEPCNIPLDVPPPYLHMVRPCLLPGTISFLSRCSPLFLYLSPSRTVSRDLQPKICRTITTLPITTSTLMSIQPLLDSTNVLFTQTIIVVLLHASKTV